MPQDPLQHPVLTSSDAARAALEALRWRGVPTCPRCNGSEGVAAVDVSVGRSYRTGLYRCKDCRRQFTVTVGTPIADTRAPLTAWWVAAHTLTSGGARINVSEVERAAGVTYRTAWRIVQVFKEAVTKRNLDRIAIGFPLRAYVEQERGKRKRAKYDPENPPPRKGNPTPRHRFIPATGALKDLPTQAINLMALMMSVTLR